MSAGSIIRLRRLTNELDNITASVGNVNSVAFLRKAVEIQQEAGRLVQEAMSVSSTADK